MSSLFGGKKDNSAALLERQHTLALQRQELSFQQQRKLQEETFALQQAREEELTAKAEEQQKLKAEEARLKKAQSKAKGRRALIATTALGLRDDQGAVVPSLLGGQRGTA